MNNRTRLAGLVTAAGLALASTGPATSRAIPDRRLPFDAEGTFAAEADFDALYVREPFGGGAPVAATGQLSERVLKVWANTAPDALAGAGFVERRRDIYAARDRGAAENLTEEVAASVVALANLDREEAAWKNNAVGGLAARLMGGETTGMLLHYVAQHDDGGIFLSAAVHELALRVLGGTLRLRVAGESICGEQTAYTVVQRMIAREPERNVSTCLHDLVRSHVEENRAALLEALLPIVDNAEELYDGTGDLYADDAPTGGLVRIKSKPTLTQEEYAHAREMRAARKARAKANKRGGKHKRRF